MDKNSVIGLVLIGLLLVAYTIYQRPSEAEIAEQQRIQDSIATAQAEKQAEQSVKSFENSQTELTTPGDTSAIAPIAVDSIDNAVKNEALKLKYGVLANATQGESQEIEITTDLLKLRFSNKGGVPVYAELVEFTTYDSLPLVLFDEQTSNFGMEFTYPSLGNFNTSEFHFTTNASTVSINKNDSQEI